MDWLLCHACCALLPAICSETEYIQDVVTTVPMTRRLSFDVDMKCKAQMTHRDGKTAPHYFHRRSTDAKGSHYTESDSLVHPTIDKLQRMFVLPSGGNVKVFRHGATRAAKTVGY